MLNEYYNYESYNYNKVTEKLIVKSPAVLL